MTHGSLFSGIGGFDLASHWLGCTNVFNCEIDPFCQKVLKHHFPNSQQYADITKTDFTKYKGAIDVVSGGFPCQPFSVAGKRKGASDDRFLWHEMLRAIREIEPSWVIAENVRGLISQDGGLVFEQVLSDLETACYEVQPFVIPAVSVNAPHRRDRVWIVANTKNDRTRGLQSKSETQGTQGCDVVFRKQHSVSVIEHSERIGRLQNNENKQTKQLEQDIPNWWRFPTQSPICSRDDGISAKLDDITFSKLRRESIKAYGNAIVQQVAYQIFKVINQLYT